jgi:hypothetical protein
LPGDYEPSGRERARMEHCLKCGSTSMRNNLYFQRGKDIKVYVQCAGCGEYVASYVISGYITDCGYESYLRSLRFKRMSSGKRVLKKIRDFADNVRAEYDHVLELIRTQEDDHLIPDIIEEESSDVSDTDQF